MSKQVIVYNRNQGISLPDEKQFLSSLQNVSSKEANQIVNKMYGMFRYINDTDLDLFNADHKEIGLALDNVELPSDERQIITQMWREMALMSAKIKFIGNREKHELALAEKGVSIERARGDIVKEQTSLVQENRRTWLKQEIAGIVLSGSVAGATTVGVDKITSFYDMAKTGLDLTSDWLKNPAGWCTKEIKTVTESGFFGTSTRQIEVPSSNMFCSTLDSLSNGLTGFAQSASNLKQGSLILVFIVSFILVYFLYKILTKRIRLGVIKMEFGKKRRGSVKKRSRSVRKKRGSVKKRSRSVRKKRGSVRKKRGSVKKRSRSSRKKRSRSRR